MERKISLLSMGQGNMIALRRTIESFSSVCDEIIYGDLLIFPEDREILNLYATQYNLKIITYPFDYIFKNGFSAILNDLASHANNDMCVYSNTAEVIDIDYGINKIVNENPECNTFYFTHPEENHRWFRMYDRREMKWSGVIHEQLYGEYRPYHKPVYQMADTPKDMYSDFKAKVFDSIKAIVYFNNYMKIVDHPEMLGETDPGWVKFAIAEYEGMKQRLQAKEDEYKAFINGNYDLYMNAIYSPSFMNDDLKSSSKIEYQSDPVYLGKTPNGMMVKHFRNKVIKYKSRPEFWDQLEGWEAETFDVLDRFLKPGDVFLDIGAWNGVLSLYAHLMGAIPYAVEADTVAFTELETIFEVNDIPHSNAAFIAVADRAGSVEIMNKQECFGDSMSSIIKREGKDAGTRVNSTTLEEIIDFWDIKPDFIKIDTEGAEVLIIPSSVHILKKLKAPLLLSVHPQWVDTKPVFEALAKVYDRYETLIHDAYLFLP